MKRQAGYLIEKKGSITVLAISNPPGNTVREPEFIRIGDFEKLLNRKDLKGVIIKGTGRHFSSGADLEKLRQMVRNGRLLRSSMENGAQLLNAIRNADVPVVAAINGVCFGAGLEIALACHIRISSEKALFAFPEIIHGLIPGLGGSALLADRTGEGRAMEIILSGDVIDAHKAHELKITDHLVPSAKADSFAVEYLEKLTEGKEPLVIRSVMRSLHNAAILSHREALEEETKLFCALALKSFKKDNR